MTNGKLPAPPAGAPCAPRGPAGAPPRVSPAELGAVMKRQVAFYTGMESTSVPMEMTAELAESVLFCVRTALEAGGAEAGGENATLAGRLLAGQRILHRRQNETRRLQRVAEHGSLPLDNEVYRGALAETRRFFALYDIRLFAHQVPCMIDYPLALPVDDSRVKGVDYIGEWLRRRVWEDALCRLFPPAEVQGVLGRHCAGWRQLPINLFEPVLACALGKAALGPDMAALAFTGREQDALWERLGGRGTEELEAAAGKAAARLCNLLHVWGSGQRGYYAACARAMAPRLQAAGKDGFKRIFTAPAPA